MSAGIITRRGLLGGLVATAAVGSSAARAEWSCLPPGYDGLQQCTAGVPFPEMSFYSDGSQQERQNWCWAACISLVFRRYGRIVPQSAIVERVFGSEIDKPLAGHLIAKATASPWKDGFGNWFQPIVNVLIDNNFNLKNAGAGAIAINNMMASRPMIVGTLGHATVVTAIDFAVNFAGQHSITGVKVRDPWPYNPSPRYLSASEYYQTNFLMQVYLSP